MKLKIKQRAKLAAIAVGCIFMLCASCAQKESLHTHKLEKKLFNEHMKFARPWLPGKHFDDKIKQNIKNDVDLFFQVVQNLESISVNKTDDTDSYVITFYSDTLVASIWCYYDGTIRSITPY